MQFADSYHEPMSVGFAQTQRKCSAQSVPVYRMFVNGLPVSTYASVDSSMFTMCVYWVYLQFAYSLLQVTGSINYCLRFVCKWYGLPDACNEHVYPS